MTRSRPGLSVVVPTVDEAEHLPRLLSDLTAQRGVDYEIIVADGGSRDATREIAQAFGVRWIDAPRGRGRQMNAGAAVAHHACLLFVHADSALTANDQLRAAVDRLRRDEHDQTGPRAGHFPLRFVDTRDRAPFLFRYMQAKTRSGRRLTINGDQGLLIGRAAFAALGGFDDSRPFLEDQALAAAIEAAGGGFCLLEHPLETSARRFVVEGVRRRYALMALIMAMHGAGVSAFLDRASEVYRRQGAADRLALMPYLGLLGRLAMACGLRRTASTLWRVAGLAADEGWQMAFALDVVMTRNDDLEPRWTRRYDRALAPLVRGIPGRTVIACLLGMALLAPAWMHAVCSSAKRKQDPTQ